MATRHNLRGGTNSPGIDLDEERYPAKPKKASRIRLDDDSEDTAPPDARAARTKDAPPIYVERDRVTTRDEEKTPAGNFVFSAVGETVKRRANVFAVVVATAAVLFLLLYIATESWAAALLALGISVFLGWPLKQAIAKTVVALLGMRLWAKAIGIAAVAAPLMVTTGAAFEYISAGAIIGCMLHLLAIDVKAAQSQIGVIECEVGD